MNFKFLISFLGIALFVPLESSSILVSVRNDGVGVVTTSKRTRIPTQDQSEARHEGDEDPAEWVATTRVSLITVTSSHKIVMRVSKLRSSFSEATENDFWHGIWHVWPIFLLRKAIISALKKQIMLELFNYLLISKVLLISSNIMALGEFWKKYGNKSKSLNWIGKFCSHKDKAR